MSVEDWALRVRRGCLSEQVWGFLVLLGQSLHMPHTLLDFAHKGIPSRAQPQLHHTGIRRWASPHDPPIPHEIIDHLSQSRWLYAATAAVFVIFVSL